MIFHLLSSRRRIYFPHFDCPYVTCFGQCSVAEVMGASPNLVPYSLGSLPRHCTWACSYLVEYEVVQNRACQARPSQTGQFPANPHGWSQSRSAKPCPDQRNCHERPGELTEVPCSRQHEQVFELKLPWFHSLRSLQALHVLETWTLILPTRRRTRTCTRFQRQLRFWAILVPGISNKDAG